MDRHREEKALRRLVANLSRTRAEDVDAVLEELAPDQRAVVRELLAACRGQPLAAPPQTGPTSPALDPQGFSRAIAERLAPGGGDRSAGWRMTEAAAEALRACARQIPPEPAAEPQQSALKGRGFQLFGRVGLGWAR